MENKGSTEEICRIYLRRIMHTYYKFDYKAHRRSLGLQGESKVRKSQKWYSLCKRVKQRLFTVLAIERTEFLLLTYIFTMTKAKVLK